MSKEEKRERIHLKNYNKIYDSLDGRTWGYDEGARVGMVLGYFNDKKDEGLEKGLLLCSMAALKEKFNIENAYKEAVNGHIELRIFKDFLARFENGFKKAYEEAYEDCYERGRKQRLWEEFEQWKANRESRKSSKSNNSKKAHNQQNR